MTRALIPAIAGLSPAEYVCDLWRHQSRAGPQRHVQKVQKTQPYGTATSHFPTYVALSGSRMDAVCLFVWRVGH